MSRKETYREYFYKKNTVAFLIVTALTAQGDAAQSAVLEQLDNNEIIVLDDGAPDGAPSAHFQDGNLYGVSVTKVSRHSASPYSSVITGAAVMVDRGDTRGVGVTEPFDAVLAERREEPGGTVETAALGFWKTPDWMKKHNSSFEEVRSRLPNPRPMSRRYTNSQTELRKLAAKVAEKYARTRAFFDRKLDRELFVAMFTTLIQRESNFNPRAVSPAGAMGLGQLMPDTARDLGVRDVFSARQNLDGSVRYLAAMFEQFDSPVLALAAYNAGPGAVRKYKGVPPYKETVQYISDILHSLNDNYNINQDDNVKVRRENALKNKSHRRFNINR